MSATILVVDDDRGIRQLLAFTLELEGHSVLSADDGLAALTIFEMSSPDLVLLDLTMPKLSGWDVARQMRQGARPGLCQVPIVLLSAHDVDEQQARSVGAVACMRKPFEPSRLVALVAEVLVATAAQPPS